MSNLDVLYFVVVMPLLDLLLRVTWSFTFHVTCQQVSGWGLCWSIEWGALVFYGTYARMKEWIFWSPTVSWLRLVAGYALVSNHFEWGLWDALLLQEVPSSTDMQFP